MLKGGYPQQLVGDHPNADRDGYVPIHILKCEKALGKHLPDKSEIHHFNEIRTDYSNTNLVICQDRAYHMLLHAKMRIVRAGGDPHLDKICTRCSLVLPRTLFNRSRSRYDGLDNKCKPCESEKKSKKQ